MPLRIANIRNFRLQVLSMPLRLLRIHVAPLTVAFVLAGLGGSQLAAQQLPPPRPKSTPTKPAPAPAPSVPKAASSLLISVDEQCAISIDGRAAGRMTAGEIKSVPVGLGKHIVRAVADRVKVEWEEIVEVKSAAQEIVTIRLKDRVAQAVRAADAARAAAAERPPAAPVPSPQPSTVARSTEASSNVSRAVLPSPGPPSPVPPLAIGELTPVPPFALPPESVEGERATAADLGRLVEWLAYLGAVLYRAGPETSSIRELYQQLDAARNETGALLTRAREGTAPSSQDYVRVRAALGRLHERIQTLRGA